MELRHLQEDHDRLMERHSALLQEMASKELAARNKHEQLVLLANQAEKARQDGLTAARESVDSVKQSYRVSDLTVNDQKILILRNNFLFLK